MPLAFHLRLALCASIIPYPSTDTYLLQSDDHIKVLYYTSLTLMNLFLLALITPCNQGPLQGHGPLSEGLSGWIEGLA